MRTCHSALQNFGDVVQVELQQTVGRGLETPTEKLPQTGLTMLPEHAARALPIQHITYQMVMAMGCKSMSHFAFFSCPLQSYHRSAILFLSLAPSYLQLSLGVSFQPPGLNCLEALCSQSLTGLPCLPLTCPCILTGCSFLFLLRLQPSTP